MKKQQILIAASNLFMSLGYGAVSMELVAREANVSKATLYVYFKSKNELFIAMLGHYQQAQSIKPPSLPLSPALNLDDMKALLLNYIKMAYDYYVADSVVAMYRLLISEIQEFPELFGMFFGDTATGVTDSLGSYLSKYAVSVDHDSNGCFNLACQILDLVRGATIWTKLVQNPAKQYLIEQSDITVSRLHNSCMLLVTDYFANGVIKI